ncbi:nuclear transport factor 2 family protein [Streptomyces sp. NPDC048506]|uniref:nuclear transport factor 2 family protein n=1 Tax=Streptomyces sp. NPDC048506 TaxID=3155028 RepID=UPI00342BCA95
MNNRDVVLQAVDELFGDKDPAAVDRWVSPTYKQHSALAADGPEVMRELVSSLSGDFRYERARVIADGDLVALHGVYHGFGPTPLVAFDVFRVENGKLAEHWDALAPVVEATVSGRSQTDGPTQVSDPGATEANRKLVAEYAEKVLKGAEYSVATDYTSTETYLQHNPEAGDGLDGFGVAAAKWAAQGKNVVYETIHRVVAEGDFVLVQAEGEFGVPVVYFDLFRLADGKIVEHWDVIQQIPAELPHSNGLF